MSSVAIGSYLGASVSSQFVRLCDDIVTLHITPREQPGNRRMQRGMQMRVGVGLPTTVPGTSPRTVLEWARVADGGPFSSVAVLDRIAYDSYDPLIALACAAGVTERVQLAATVVVGPLRNTAVLAKSAMSLQQLSGGRLVLGLAVGAREDDYALAGVDYHARGRRFAAQLADMRGLWDDGRLDLATGSEAAPPMLIGGLSEQVFGRVARYASGYIHGGGPPRAFARSADKARAAWLDAGRPGQPLLWGQGYFALLPEHAERGASYLREYYSFTGPFAERIVDGLLRTPQDVVQFISGYAAAGCDELVLFPTVATLDELEALTSILREYLGAQVTPSGVLP